MGSDTLKRCTKCFLEKDFINFHFNSKRQNYYAHCKICHNKMQRDWTDRNKTYCREYRIKRRKLFKHVIDGQKNSHLKNVFGITLEEYNKMIISQNNVCGICHEQETAINYKKGKVRDLSVDHCHKTGRIRGLLCHKCNVGLGNFKDSPELLKSAIKYLENNKNVCYTELKHLETH